MQESDKDKIMYAGIQFGNLTAMFMDVSSGMPLIKGDNINPTISMDDKEEIKRVSNDLKVGGTVDMELRKTFFSELYGMITDKFGIIWQILYYAPNK